MGWLAVLDGLDVVHDGHSTVVAARWQVAARPEAVRQIYQLHFRRQSARAQLQGIWQALLVNYMSTVAYLS